MDFATSSSLGLDWSAAFAADPHSQPRGVAKATPRVRVAGVALRHVAALVAAALGPRRCHPRRPAALIHSRRPRRPIALVAPLPLSPPPSTPRRRRPRALDAAALDAAALDAAALDAAAHTAALRIQRCGYACTRVHCEYCEV